MIYSNGDLNEIFDKFFGGTPTYKHYKTSVISKNDDEDYEINYTKDGAYLFFDAPGFNKTNLKVELENGIILITGKRTYKLNDEEKTKSISNQFKLGDKFNSENIEATIEDGLLTVFIPSYTKQEKKRISIL